MCLGGDIMSNKSSSKPTPTQPVGKNTRFEEIRNGSGYKDNSNLDILFKKGK